MTEFSNDHLFSEGLVVFISSSNGTTEVVFKRRPRNHFFTLLSLAHILSPRSYFKDAKVTRNETGLDSGNLLKKFSEKLVLTKVFTVYKNGFPWIVKPRKDNNPFTSEEFIIKTYDDTEIIIRDTTKDIKLLYSAFKEKSLFSSFDTLSDGDLEKCKGNPYYLCNQYYLQFDTFMKSYTYTSEPRDHNSFYPDGDDTPKGVLEIMLGERYTTNGYINPEHAVFSNWSDFELKDINIAAPDGIPRCLCSIKGDGSEGYSVYEIIHGFFMTFLNIYETAIKPAANDIPENALVCIEIMNSCGGEYIVPALFELFFDNFKKDCAFCGPTTNNSWELIISLATIKEGFVEEYSDLSTKVYGTGNTLLNSNMETTLNVWTNTSSELADVLLDDSVTENKANFKVL